MTLNNFFKKIWRNSWLRGESLIGRSKPYNLARFLAQQCSSIATPCCTKNRRCESSRVTSPLVLRDALLSEVIARDVSLSCWEASEIVREENEGRLGREWENTFSFSRLPPPFLFRPHSTIWAPGTGSRRRKGGLPLMAYKGRLQAYEREGISLVELYKRVGKCVIWVCERDKRVNRWLMSYLKHSAFTAVKTDAKFEIRYVKGLSSLLSHVSGASSCQDIPPISLSIRFSFTFRFSLPPPARGQAFIRDLAVQCLATKWQQNGGKIRSASSKTLTYS